MLLITITAMSWGKRLTREEIFIAAFTTYTDVARGWETIAGLAVILTTTTL
jgi:hypothetical protein